MSPLKGAKTSFILQVLLYLLETQSTLEAQTKTYAIKAARLFDGISGTPLEPGLVIVSDGKVQSAGKSIIPPGATVIDPGDATLLLGFIDTHTHVSDEFNADYDGPPSRPATPRRRAKR
jgi:imidazolonepropionase-like amidohydrolase